jgi:hypothetical protein
MHNADDLPPVPQWFVTQVLALASLYPSATPNTALTVAWWRYLYELPQPALEHGFALAPRQSKQFMPSAEMVRDIAASWRAPTPRPNLDLPVLPEREEELPPELAAIRERQRRGEITSQEATKAFLRWTVDRL